MRRISLLVFIVMAALLSGLSFAQSGDADGDGVGDSRDRCPDVAGPTHLMGCPDNDNDRVPDIDDACAAIPGIPENRGCPQDTDGDSVGDFEDQCPHESGTAANRGCAQAPDSDDAGGSGQLTDTRPERNPLVPPADGECLSAPIFNNRVNARSFPGSRGDIVAVVEPNILLPVSGLIELPGEESYYIYKLEDLIISGITVSPRPSSLPMAFDAETLDAVFIAASIMNIAGDCGPTPVALLLPAVQSAREAARRASSSSSEIPAPILTARKTGGDGATYMEVQMEDAIISSYVIGASGGGVGKVSLQDFHFAVPPVEIVGTPDGDALVFDLLSNADDGGQAAVYMKIQDVKGESTDLPPGHTALWWILSQAAQPEGESCLADIAAAPAEYGLDIIAAFADADCQQNAGGHKEWIELVSWGSAAGAQPLMRIGEDAVVIGSLGFGSDGAVCIDLQFDPAAPLCVPAARPEAQ